MRRQPNFYHINLFNIFRICVLKHLCIINFDFSLCCCLNKIVFDVGVMNSSCIGQLDPVSDQISIQNVGTFKVQVNSEHMSEKAPS